MAKKPNKKELIAVAQELNDILKPDPPIDIEATIAVMLKEVTQAADLLAKDDELSKETAESLKGWGIEHKAKVPSAQLEKKPEKKKEKGKKSVSSSITRFGAVAKVMKDGKSPLKREALIEKSNQIYAESGGSDNLKEARWAVGVTIQVLNQFHLLEVGEDDTYAFIQG